MPSIAPNLEAATAELKAREPIFHHPEFGTARADFESMLTSDFWEVGASGQKCSKHIVLDTLEQRHKQPVDENLEVTNFECRQLAPSVFLTTYLLDDAGRRSRRATIWRWDAGSWLIQYHQGTLVAGG